MKSSGIAIVGMACRFPGARNIDEFWRNLRDGVESVRALSDTELLAAGVAAEELARADYVKAAAILGDVDMFDASFFGFSPRDAAIMDPQHRHFLECAWEALEDAGHDPERFAGSIGVFAGSGMNAYMVHNLLKNRRLLDSAGLFLIRQTGNDKDVLATRVSYQLDLRGPSLNVQTACSTSLVAVHLACQSLLGCECDMALAGGVTIEIPHAHGYVYREGEILSRDGRCRAFDAASSGTIFSSGVGLVVLRRLEDAIEDLDTIYAVILGTAVNNDGQRKVGYFAPSVAGQAEVIAEALGVAGVNSDSISYVETHGTGTAVGDPIEIKGLTQAFSQGTNRKRYCAIGSLKTNVGHLDAAAGVASLIKTAMALRHRQLPASLHFQTANPQIDFENTPFYVNTSLADWPATGGPRRAGVTSLGIGGTNAHVVLEEAPQPTRPETSRPYQLLTLSARTETALETMAAELATHLDRKPELRLADVAFTCQVGRKPFRYRRIVVASSLADAVRTLPASESRRGFAGSAASPASSPVFLFSGQGSQYVNMSGGIYASEPVFRDCLDSCAAQLRPHLGLDLRDILFPSAESSASAADQLNSTAITQPALFAIEYSLAMWWMAHGVRPQAMVGHSIGEYVAACLAGVLSLEDGLAVTALRGRLMQECEPGAMLAVALSPAAITLAGNVSLAAVNAPEQCVLSGPTDAVAKIEQKLTSQGVACHRLLTSHAFHSAMIEPALVAFTERMRGVKLRPPKIPYLSNHSGTWITAAEATDPEYWARHLRNTVRFSDCASNLLRRGNHVMLEVGPGQTLSALVRQQSGKDTTVVSSLRRREETVHDMAVLLGAMGQLWITGQPVDWSALHQGDAVGRVPLPTYPFERQRFWIDPDKGTVPQHVEQTSSSNTPAAPLAAQNREQERTVQAGLDHWLYRRQWSRTARPTAASRPRACWLVLLDRSGLGTQIVIQLRGAGHDVIEVTAGSAYKRSGRGRYTIRPGVRDDYDALLLELAKRKKFPQKIVHLWTVGRGTSDVSLDEKLDLSFYGLLFLAQALGNQNVSGVDVAVVSDRLHSLAGEPVIDPVCATVLGLARVIPKELSGITCRCIDVDLASQGPGPLAVEIVTEHGTPFSDPVVALREGERWTESLERIDLGENSTRIGFRQNGVYLITGGLGDLGLVIAEELARRFKARLVLLGRTAFPSPEQWTSLLNAADTPERVRQQIRKLLDIQSLTAELQVVCGDVSRRDDIKRAVDVALENFGSINGVIHAAGIVDDGPLQLKSREGAARVLDPKVRGTLLLSDVLQEASDKSPEKVSLDFLILFSSVSSFLAPAGQADYAAANAFLDAFAMNDRGVRVVAINWGPWRDVGMAARTRSLHPLLGRRLVDNANEMGYSVSLSYDRHWVLAEHRLNTGTAVLSGTSYLEMAAAALTRGSFDRGVEFEDVYFLSPYFVHPGETRETHVHLHQSDKGAFQFSVRTRDAGWTEHATGQIARCSRRLPPEDVDPAQIKARCNTRVIRFDDTRRTEQEAFFAFGPRWRNLIAIHLGEDEGIADLELAREFAGDTSTYQLHPALLDLATGSALYLIEDYDKSRSVYFPLSYKRATIYRPLPAKFHSHIRSRQRNMAGADVATFNLTLLDTDGKVLGEIEDFSMRLVRDPQQALGIGPARMPAAGAQHHSHDGREVQGIAPADGARTLTRILSSDVPSGVVVLPDGLTSMAIAADTVTRPQLKKTSAKDDVEAVLAQWWKELLGLDQVDVDDDFFELGGHSLIVVRLFSEIKKTYGINFSLSTLFEARTIRKLATLMREAGTTPHSAPKSGPALVPIQPKGTRVPLYVISGLGGNVIKFHGMAFYLGEDQPVYGLLPRGLDGREPYHTRVEDMAAYYVEAIQKVQSQGPYHLVGYSFGGAVALEVAQQLIVRGAEVGLLGMFDTIEWKYMERVSKLRRIHQRLAGDRTAGPAEASDKDPYGMFTKRLKAKALRTIFRIFQALGRRVPLRLGTIEDINTFAGASYRPKVYPGKLTLFRATRRRPQDGDDAFLGWGNLIAGGIEVFHVPAAHFDILQEPGVKILSEQLRKCLDREPARDSLAPGVGAPAD